MLGAGIVDEIGANTIKIQHSSDETNWTTAKAFTKANYPSMIDYNTSSHFGKYSATVPSGKQYRAYVEFYGEQNGSSTTRYYYTPSI